MASFQTQIHQSTHSILQASLSFFSVFGPEVAGQDTVRLLNILYGTEQPLPLGIDIDVVRRLLCNDDFLSCCHRSSCATRASRQTPTSMCSRIAAALCDWVESSDLAMVPLNLLHADTPHSIQASSAIIFAIREDLMRSNATVPESTVRQLLSSLGEDGLLFLAGMRRTVGSVRVLPPHWGFVH